MEVKVVLLVLFFASMVGIGIYCRKRASNVGEFVLGGRSVGPWLSAFAYGTSYFSAVVFIGYAGQFGAKFGISAAWIGVGNALIGSMLAWLVLGNKTRVMSKQLNASTMPEFFEKRYDSKSLKIVSAIIIFIFLVPYTASIYKGLSSLFLKAFNLEAYNIPFEYCIIAMAVITAIYVVVGGYMATAINDFIQGIIMIAGIIIITISILNQNGGLIGSINELGKQGSEYTSVFGPDVKSLISVIILTSLGTWGLPQMVHKFYTIKDKAAVKRGTVISTIFAVIVAGGSYFLGAFGRLFGNNEELIANKTFDDIMPNMLSVLPDILMGVVIILVLSASMSTLSALVISSSSTFTLDFIKPLFPKMKEKNTMLIIRILCAVFVLISVVIALIPNPITKLMAVAWGALSGAFLAPFLYGLYWKGVTKAGVWAGFVTGLGITVSNLFIGFINDSIVAAAIAMLASLIVVPVVSLLTPKISPEHVDSIFQKTIENDN